MILSSSQGLEAFYEEQFRWFYAVDGVLSIDTDGCDVFYATNNNQVGRLRLSDMTHRVVTLPAGVTSMGTVAALHDRFAFHLFFLHTFFYKKTFFFDHQDTNNTQNLFFFFF